MNEPETFTKKEQVAEFPAGSVTVYLTVLSPISKSFGRFVSTLTSLIVNRMVNESSVTPGSFSVSELSVKPKTHVTVDTFVPGSLSAGMVSPAEQLIVGGCQSDHSKYIYKKSISQNKKQSMLMNLGLSRLSLNGHFFKTGTLVKRRLGDGFCLSLLPLFDSLQDRHSSKTDTSQRCPP